MQSKKIKQFILNLPRLVKRFIVIGLDVFLCALTSWLSFGLRLDEWGALTGNQLLVLITAIAISIPIFMYQGLYLAIFRYIGSTALNSILQIFLIYGGIFFCLFTLIGVDDVPRSIGVIQPILLFLGVGFSRYSIRYWLTSNPSLAKQIRINVSSIVFVYGAGAAGRQLAVALENAGDLVVKGFIDDSLQLQGRTINGTAVYSVENAKNLISSFGITDIVLAIPSVDQMRRSEIIETLSCFGVRVRTLPGFNDIASGRIRLTDLHDLNMNDLLGRNEVSADMRLLKKNIYRKNVLVTGAGGSIGSELCRQIIKMAPKALILVENNEHSLYLIYEELKLLAKKMPAPNQNSDGESNFSDHLELDLFPCLASVRDRELMYKILSDYQPDILFHAAAYKHVPLVEQNPSEGIRNNVLGTLNCAQLSLEAKVPHFVLISTDKAVRPTNVMGASKRICELILQALAEYSRLHNQHTLFSMVRFGNVLGSSGSVVPLFRAQIKAGGPITLTHTDVVRYFMTIPEAAQLVIQSSAMASGGDVFILDMGEPVRIYDLALKMVYLSGLMVKDELHPNGDIEIKVTGLRPGEKLYEELLLGDDPQSTIHPKIMKSHEEFLLLNDLFLALDSLYKVLEEGDVELIRNELKRLVPDYCPEVTT